MQSRIDKKFKKLGYDKVCEEKNIVQYQKFDSKLKTSYNIYIAFDYLYENHYIKVEKISCTNYNSSMKLGIKEAKLALKKYKEMKRKYGW